MASFGLLNGQPSDDSPMSLALKKKREEVSKDGTYSAVTDDAGSPDTDLSTKDVETNWAQRFADQYLSKGNVMASDPEMPNRSGTDKPTDVTPIYDKSGKRSWKIIHEK